MNIEKAIKSAKKKLPNYFNGNMIHIDVFHNKDLVRVTFKRVKAIPNDYWEYIHHETIYKDALILSHD